MQILSRERSTTAQKTQVRYCSREVWICIMKRTRPTRASRTRIHRPRACLQAQTALLVDSSCSIPNLSRTDAPASYHVGQTRRNTAWLLQAPDRSARRFCGCRAGAPLKVSFLCSAMTEAKYAPVLLQTTRQRRAPICARSLRVGMPRQGRRLVVTRAGFGCRKGAGAGGGA